MAECCRDIVYRANDGELKMSAAVAGDDAALVKAYDKAITSFQGSDCEEEVQVPTDEQEGSLKAAGHSEEPDDGTVSIQDWGVGSRCRACWSVDGLVYPAVLVWVEGPRGRVKFDGYGNEEELELSMLLPGEPELWTVGSQCRVVWSGDGLVYPAVLISINGDRGRVRFDGYGNEEELELSALLPPGEPEPSDSAATQALKRSPDGGSSSSDCKNKEKQKISVDREGLYSLGSSCVTGTGEDSSNYYTRSKKERRSTKMTGSWRGRPAGSCPTSAHPFPSFPSVPAANESSEGFLPLVPPPPPFCTLPTRAGADGGIAGLDQEVAHLSSMLLSWYLCGYHTGYYMAKQRTKANAVTDTKKPKHGYKCEKP
ncbi:survival of motor neuron protein-like [Brienomyrus brachyistius]|uniref:survival of motor neuron protein-like n=1 Tax=Brienomyrus brachyistius TaxID=42636 RepID=UPI0020B31129|nr:survival of motor neuron protein-like [Brienomyrus brachyistius]